MKYDPVKYWSERIKRVGTVNTTKGNNDLHPTEERLIRKYIEPYSEILDYGIGEGRTIPIYKELHLKCTGFDIADQSELINAKLASLPEKYEFFTYSPICAIQQLPYPDLTFDVVVSFYVLTHCVAKDVRLVLNEITRLGKIAIVSAYDDQPLALSDETYCFSYDYPALFKEMGLRVIETEKPTKVRFWVLEKIK